MPPLSGQIITPEDITEPIDALDARVTELEGIQSNALGINYATSNQSVTDADDLDGLSVTVEIPSTQLIKITGHVLISMDADCGFMGSVFEGGTRLGRFGWDSDPQSRDEIFDGSVVVEATAGSHTYRLYGERTIATGSWVATNSVEAGYILVQAIGRT